ncbi:hypothetical protein ACK32R_03600 [Aeromonas dhakensis]|uniref:hypothetical protein n=1 Tax=Aeromonas dhakensis TaxID=196024 RepID=UPI003985FA58
MKKLSKEELRSSSIDALKMIALDTDGHAENVWKKAAQVLYPNASPLELEDLSSKLFQEAGLILGSLTPSKLVEEKSKRGLAAMGTTTGIRMAK